MRALTFHGKGDILDSVPDPKISTAATRLSVSSCAICGRTCTYSMA
jgi:hypothetical protein